MLEQTSKERNSPFVPCLHDRLGRQTERGVAIRTEGLGSNTHEAVRLFDDGDRDVEVAIPAIEANQQKPVPGFLELIEACSTTNK